MTGPLRHVVEEVVFVKNGVPVVFVEEIGAEKRSHQVVVSGDTGPHGWPHRIESGVHDLGGVIRFEVLSSVLLIRWQRLLLRG